MAAATMAMRQNKMYLKGMETPFIISIVFHISLVVFGFIVIPLLKFEPPVIEDTPISVEILEIDDIAKADKEPETRPVKREPTNKAEAPPRPVMPTNKAEAPPKPVAPTPPEKMEVAPPDPVPPMPQDVAAPTAKPEPPKSKPKPPEKTKPEPEKPVAEPQNEAFKSLLKNLEENESQDTAKKPEEKEGERAPLLTRFNQKMTMGELDALKRQLSQCWSIQAGARYAEDLVVTLKLFVNPDRTVRDVKIMDTIRYNTDSFFRSAADSAQRAVYRCSPLDLPPEKHDLWDVITINFDPSEML